MTIVVVAAAAVEKTNYHRPHHPSQLVVEVVGESMGVVHSVLMLRYSLESQMTFVEFVEPASPTVVRTTWFAALDSQAAVASSFPKSLSGRPHSS